MIRDRPWDEAWPAAGLEAVPACTVCRSTERSTLLQDVVDGAFKAAAGRWRLVGCQQCGSAYLDPRPTPETIGSAYSNYYTHVEPKTAPALNTFRNKIIRTIANGYRNHRFGTSHAPASAFGTIIASLVPQVRRKLERQYRWLPRPAKGAWLLDVGCGNGGFLIQARDAGWEAKGVDFDPAAVELAQAKGVDVRCGPIDAMSDFAERFDAVTIHHVIEHVYDPVRTLEDAYSLLKENGFLYVETPNIRSLGAKIYRHDWRGLEAPRHLTLFNVESLTKLLFQAGFRDIQVKRRNEVTTRMIRASRAIRSATSSRPAPSALVILATRLIAKLGIIPIGRLEFVTVTARKPRG